MKPVLTLEETSALIKAASAGTPGVTDAQLDRVIQWAEEARMGVRLSAMAIKGELAIRVPAEGDDFGFSLTPLGQENAKRTIEKLFAELVNTLAKEIASDAAKIVETLTGTAGGQ